MEVYVEDFKCQEERWDKRISLFIFRESVHSWITSHICEGWILSLVSAYYRSFY
jgi:hypothetical protein